MLTILSSLYTVLSAFYIVKTIRLVVLLLQLNTSITSAHSPDFLFLKFVPLLLTLPGIFSIAALIFFHSALKIRQPTPLSFILGIVFILLIPIPLWYMGNTMITPIIPKIFGPLWQDETVLLSGLIFIILLFLRKRFSAEGEPLSKKSRIVLLAFFIIFTLPTLLWTEYIFYKSNNPDYKRDQTQKSARFYLYEPTYFPKGRTYETTYFPLKKGLINGLKTVEVHMNYPLADIMRGKKSGLIIVKQSGLPKSFDIKKFVENDRKDITAVQIKKLSTAKKDTAYIKNNKNAHYLYFISNRNTLITINAFYINEPDLLKFAESLE